MGEHTWRPLRPNDAEAWAALMRTIPHRDRPVERVDIAEFVDDMSLPGVSEEDSVGVFDGSALVGCATVRPTPADGERCEIVSGTHPEQVGTGLDARLLDWALGRAVRTSGGVLYVVLHNGGYGWLHVQLARHGLDPARYPFATDAPAPSTPEPAASNGSAAGQLASDCFDSAAPETSGVHFAVDEKKLLTEVLHRAYAVTEHGGVAVVHVAVALNDRHPNLEDLIGDSSSHVAHD